MIESSPQMRKDLAPICPRDGALMSLGTVKNLSPLGDLNTILLYACNCGLCYNMEHGYFEAPVEDHIRQTKMYACDVGMTACGCYFPNGTPQARFEFGDARRWGARVKREGWCAAPSTQTYFLTGACGSFLSPQAEAATLRRCLRRTAARLN